MPRPRIAILGRWTESASALRYRGVVSSRALLESVWAAGGDPVTLLPGDTADALDWDSRVAGFGGILLPGGGDVHPSRYGAPVDESMYDMDSVQDEADFSLATYALDRGIPMLAVCRGLHVVNALLGGTLIADMPKNHRHVVHDVPLDDPSNVLGIDAPSIAASCYHHQALDRVADAMTVLGRAADGTVEAVSVEAQAWTAGVQWHPEDTAATDPRQVALLARLVREAATR
jgi:putative glutamine amidotransferase